MRSSTLIWQWTVHLLRMEEDVARRRRQLPSARFTQPFVHVSRWARVVQCLRSLWPSKSKAIVLSMRDAEDAIQRAKKRIYDEKRRLINGPTLCASPTVTRLLHIIELRQNTQRERAQHIVRYRLASDAMSTSC